MPLFSFQKMFVSWVIDESKRHTIRGFRKHPVRVGQRITYMTGSRFKPVKIKESMPVKDVKCIFMTANGHLFIIDTNWLHEVERQQIKEIGTDAICYPFVELTGTARDEFAWKDGFRHSDDPSSKHGCFTLMLAWWRRTHQLPWVGFITYW